MIMRLASALAACAALSLSAAAFAQDAEPGDGEKVDIKCEVKKMKNDDGTVETVMEGDCEGLDVDGMAAGTVEMPEGAKMCKVMEIKNDDGTVERTVEGDCDDMHADGHHDADDAEGDDEHADSSDE